MNRSIWQSIGFDESNHGFDKKNYSDFPEICVAMAARDEDDINKRSNLPKHRCKINFIGELNYDYSFLLFSESDRLNLQDNEKLGVVLGSLIKDQSVKYNIDFFVDGVWHEWDKDFARDVISDVTRLSKNCIKITDGKDLDRKIRIVNYADIKAYYLLSKKTLNDLKKDPHRKNLLREYVTR